MAGLELEMEILDDRGKTVIQHRDLTRPLQYSVKFVILIPALDQASYPSSLPSLLGLPCRV